MDIAIKILEVEKANVNKAIAGLDLERVSNRRGLDNLDARKKEELIEVNNQLFNAITLLEQVNELIKQTVADKNNNGF